MLSTKRTSLRLEKRPLLQIFDYRFPAGQQTFPLDVENREQIEWKPWQRLTGILKGRREVLHLDLHLGRINGSNRHFIYCDLSRNYQALAYGYEAQLKSSLTIRASK